MDFIGHYNSFFPEFKGNTIYNRQTIKLGIRFDLSEI